MNTRLHILMVDDEPMLCTLFAEILDGYGAHVTTHLSTASAIDFLDSVCRFRQQLDLVITDLIRPASSGGVEGISLIRHIRSRPYDALLFGGFRLRKIPIIVTSGAANRAHFRDEVAHIDSDIPVLQKPVSVEELLKTVGNVLRRHRNAVLRDFQEAGLAFFWKSGRYRVAHAFRVPVARSKYWQGSFNAAEKLYTRLVLVAEGGQFGDAALSTLETILNEPTTREQDLQEFFECYPEFLGEDHDYYWAEPILKSTATGRVIRPDFVLQPMGMREAPWRWTVLDLKQPTAPLLSGRRFHPTLSSYVQRAATQLRDYGKFFEDPRNRALLESRFGGIAPKPKLTAVIGRLPTRELERYAELRSTVAGVTITTYDEIIEAQRSRMQWMKAVQL